MVIFWVAYHLGDHHFQLYPQRISLSFSFCAEALLLDSQPSIASRNRCSVARVPALGV